MSQQGFTLLTRADQALYALLIILLVLSFAAASFVYLIAKFRSKIGKKTRNLARKDV